MKKLQLNTNSSQPYLGEKRKYDAGYLTAKAIAQINDNIKNLTQEKKLQAFMLKDVLYVVTEFKQKRLDPNKVYLDMGEEKLPISQIRLLSSDKIGTQTVKDQYFYLYYDCEGNRTHEEVEVIKEAVKQYLGAQTNDATDPQNG